LAVGNARAARSDAAHCRGKTAMERTAQDEPAKFVAICASLIPKDVQ
jgi:hypothetical protein